VAVGGGGELIVTGEFSGTLDFDVGAGTDIRSSVGSYDVFVTTLDASGGTLWTRAWGSPLGDYGGASVAPGDGTVVSFGSFSGTIDFGTPGAPLPRTAAPGGDVFVTRYVP
jgi:hypothetical protein